MHSIVTTFRGAVIKVEVANFCAAMDTLIDQDACIQKCKHVGGHRILIFMVARNLKIHHGSLHQVIISQWSLTPKLHDKRQSLTININVKIKMVS